MLWAVALLLAFLPLGSQTFSHLEGRMMSVVTRPTGSHVVMTCDIHAERRCIHWYQAKEGKAPQRLLYYDSSQANAVVDKGLSPGKYHVYEDPVRSFKFVVRDVRESDSGVYYCATWTYTVIQTCPYLYKKFATAALGA